MNYFHGKIDSNWACESNDNNSVRLTILSVVHFDSDASSRLLALLRTDWFRINLQMEFSNGYLACLVWIIQRIISLNWRHRLMSSAYPSTLSVWCQHVVHASDWTRPETFTVGQHSAKLRLPLECSSSDRNVHRTSPRMQFENGNWTALTRFVRIGQLLESDFLHTSFFSSLSQPLCVCQSAVFIDFLRNTADGLWIFENWIVIGVRT